MGPLGAIWLKIDEIKKGKSDDSLDLKDTLELIEKAVICVGQANVQIKYFRRLALVSYCDGECKESIQNACRVRRGVE